MLPLTRARGHARRAARPSGLAVLVTRRASVELAFQGPAIPLGQIGGLFIGGFYKPANCGFGRIGCPYGLIGQDELVQFAVIKRSAGSDPDVLESGWLGHRVGVE